MTSKKTVAKETEPPKRRPGRPSLGPKVRVNYRMKPIVVDTVKSIKKQGKYPSQDAVIEHTVMHAKDCEAFVPGEPGAVWTKEGEVEKVDLSDL